MHLLLEMMVRSSFICVYGQNIRKCYSLGFLCQGDWGDIISVNYLYSTNQIRNSIEEIIEK